MDLGGPLLWTYFTLGPVAWLVLLLGLWLGRRRMVRLAQSWPGPPLPDDAPLISVMIPARDEADGIAAAVASVLEQTYPKLEVLAVDDRSTDGTGTILDDLAAQSQGRVRAIHVSQGALPGGWLGKCHALHLAGAQARGEWLLFVDSDVRLEDRRLVAASVGLSIARKYDAVSLLTRLDCRSHLERLVLPVAAGTWLTMNAASFTNIDSHRRIAYANGQYMLVRRDAYNAVGGHEAVKDRITEDVELFRLLKAAGRRVRLFTGARFASTRMHATFGQMLRGWGRIYSGTTRRSPWRIVGALLFVVFAGFSAYVALAGGAVALVLGHPAGASWLAASLAHLLAMTIALATIYRGSGNSMLYALAFPGAAACLAALLVFALRWCATGRIEWRGTVFQQDQAPTSARVGRT